MSVKLIIGPMWAGKSSHMGACLERHRLAKQSCIVVKYSLDNRYESVGLRTHSGREYLGFPVASASHLGDIVDELQYYDAIGIDEVQFFEDAVEHIQLLAIAGKFVYAAGLDADYLAKPFSVVTNLLPLSEKVKKLSSVCNNCGKDASFSKRITNDTTRIVIGGHESYSTLCRVCMFGHS
mgnify:FL=1